MGKVGFVTGEKVLFPTCTEEEQIRKLHEWVEKITSNDYVPAAFKPGKVTYPSLCVEEKVVKQKPAYNVKCWQEL